MAKLNITEDQLEQLCLDWFKGMDYEYVCGYDIAPGSDNPECTDYRQVQWNTKSSHTLKYSPDNLLSQLLSYHYQVGVAKYRYYSAVPILKHSSKTSHLKLAIFRLGTFWAQAYFGVFFMF
jgi:type I restriction enzyme R subunit